MEMQISKVDSILKFSTKKEVVRCLLYLKLIEKGIQLSENELSMLSEFTETEDKDKVILDSLDKKYVKSKQSGENCVSKLTNLGILNKLGIGRRLISKEFYSSINTDYIAATVKIHNLN